MTISKVPKGESTGSNKTSSNAAELEPWLTHWEPVLLVALALGLGIVGMLEIFRSSIGFDEVIQLSYFNNLAHGLRVHQDFWCCYSIAALAFFPAIFGKACSSIYVLVAIRIICFTIMALTLFILGRIYARMRLPAAAGMAIGCLHFSDPNICWISVQLRPDAFSNLLGMTAMLLVLSDVSLMNLVGFGACVVGATFIMPKGIYVNALILIVMAVRAYRGLRLRGLLALAAGGASSIALYIIVCFAYGTTPWQDLEYSNLLLYRWQVDSSQDITNYYFGSRSDFFVDVFCPYLFRNPALFLLVATGVILWICTVAVERRKFEEVGIGIALLVATPLYLAKMHLPYDQYLNPILLPLLAFPALGASGFQSMRVRSILASVLIAVGMGFTFVQIPAYVAGPFAFFNELDQVANVQKLLLPGDKILAAPLFPPQEPSLMFITQDEIGKGFKDLVPDESIRRQFSGDVLRDALAQQQPAVIVDGTSFPKEWGPIIYEYLQKNKDRYQTTVLNGKNAYILKARLHPDKI